MFRLIRALGFLAPVPVALLALAALLLLPGAPERQLLFAASLAVLAAGAGVTLTALATGTYFSWRMRRLARALEATLEADEPIRLRVAGSHVERRLARAFNAASGAFVQVEARAAHDRLTGVANRETLFTTLNSEIERATRHHKWLSVAFIDIDRFKPINDTFGHATGDRLLQEAARRMLACVRKSDTVARIGGDEFVVLITAIDGANSARQVADKLQATLRQPFRIANYNLSISSSIGIAVYPEHGRDAAELSRNADSAMYQAKKNGRDQVRLCQALDRLHQQWE